MLSMSSTLPTTTTTTTSRQRVPHPPRILSEPLIFLSQRQEAVVHRHPTLPQALKDYFPLPAWVPHRIIARALGHGQEGIQNAVNFLHGKPYLWATELENVHAFWDYNEPPLVIDGCSYQGGSEHYYQSQKPNPFDARQWDDGLRDVVMERALRAKVAADPLVRDLLLVTAPHPLLSIKNDLYWGFGAQMGGSNRLAALWMKIRQDLLLEYAAASSHDAETR